MNKQTQFNRIKESQCPLDNRVLVAVDESYSDARPGLTYMAVVCSLPRPDLNPALLSHRRDSQHRITPDLAWRIFVNPAAYDLIVVGMAVKSGTKKGEQVKFWSHGIRYGIELVEMKLEELNVPGSIDQVFVDGEKPKYFRDEQWNEQFGSLRLAFTPKTGGRNGYNLNLDCCAARLLAVADGLAGQIRYSVDGRWHRDKVVAIVAARHSPLAQYAPALPDFELRI
ncbi:hypothetical protein HYU16_04255 [Candidatus Woesearchaeota archaeon]|nr:hypothetical protein [Candidatus Woesearchaeota archaeon]